MSKRRKKPSVSLEAVFMYEATMALAHAYNDRLSFHEIADALMNKLRNGPETNGLAESLFETVAAFEAAVERKQKTGNALLS